jgi:putative hemolysin
LAVATVATSLLLTACGNDDAPATATTVATTSSAAPPSTAASTDSDAAAYCTDSGGTVETRQPYLNTNLDQSQWVVLAGSIDLCRFEADDADGSRIYIDILSLASTSPSLAAAAYLAKLPLPADTGGANPAAVNCAETVDTTSSWGTLTDGGGWVNLDDPVSTIVDLCVFADRSAIDQWGIAYYAGDITRGADLAPPFRFDISTAGTIFPPSAN